MVGRMEFGHPTDEMLAAYAAGTASEGIALLIAAHMTYCPACRARVSALEAVSAAMFAEGGADGEGDALLAATLARLDDPEPEGPNDEVAPAAAADDPVMPRPLARVVGVPFQDIRWRFRMPGVSELPIDLGGAERVSLLRVRPGAGVPSHTHTATEATLVLKGELCDGPARIGRGSVQVATAEDDHHPHAGPGEDCICLTVIDGGLRFTGPFGRALNLFAE